MLKHTKNSTEIMANQIVKRALTTINNVIRCYNIMPTPKMLCQIEETLLNAAYIVGAVKEQSGNARLLLVEIKEILKIIQATNNNINEISLINFSSN